MKRRIFGFQRRVWWPKWTPASKSSRIETTDIGIRSPFWLCAGTAGGAWLEPAESRHHQPGEIHRVGLRSGQSSGRLQVFRQRRLHLDLLTRERMCEREAGRVEELAVEIELAGSPVQGITRDRQVDRGDVDANLMRPSRLELHVEQCMAWEQLHDGEVGDRVARRVSVEGMAHRIASVA